MICNSCRGLKHDECANKYNAKGYERAVETKTWCDCAHKSGVIMQFSDCHHTGATATWCPTCGKVWDDPTNSDGEDTTEESNTGEAFIDPTENVTETENVKQYIKSDRGSTLPRRYKETPSS
jgi:hypothetical protein